MTTNTSNKMTAFLKPLLFTGIAMGLAAYANLGMADSAPSIQLKDVQGKVMVNTGSGYVAGNSGMQLKPGYKVTVSGNSKAKIVYANNCSQDLKGNSLIKVGTASECQVNMFDEQAFTKNAALGDGAILNQPAPDGFIWVWSAALGTAVLTRSTGNNSNQNPDASAF